LSVISFKSYVRQDFGPGELGGFPGFVFGDGRGDEGTEVAEEEKRNPRETQEKPKTQVEKRYLGHPGKGEAYTEGREKRKR
jgi:hypothetical protein